ncbi:MAG TPA: hypothetical protein PK890_08640, partial [Terrimesophilobacter sp.]|nr:hypothetical protein [Terrimesophilobacter sp.]
MRNWIRPAIATASIVAVAATSVVIGAFFAPAPAAAPPTTSEAATASIPVLQPAGYGDHWMPDDEAVSAEQRSRVVPVDAEGAPAPGADVEEAVRVLSEAPDPVVDTWDIDEVGGTDDPCAPAEGEPGTDCPEGLRGATFSVISPDSLWGMFRANPPVEITNPYEIAHCPAADVSETALRFSVVTNAPGAIELKYWPRGDERAVTTINLSSSPVQTRDWETALANADEFEGDWTTLQHCATLEALDKYVSYYYELRVEDVLGREFTSSLTRPFSLPDDRTAPEFRVTPLGENAILASAPHRENSEVRFNVQVLDPGDTEDCTVTTDRLPLVDPSSGSTTVTVPDEYLADNGYLPGYTKRTSIGVYVPSGSTVLVCAGVFEDDRPGWQWLEAQYRYSMIVHTPGGPRPLISVGGVTMRTGYEDTSFTIDGQFEGTGSHVECVIYDGRADLTPCGSDRHSVSGGDLMVTTRAGTGENRATYSVWLPLGSVSCEPGCASPDTAWYLVPIKLQERPGETCGTGLIGPCPE